MALGRPMMTQQRTISLPLPSPLADDFTTGEAVTGLQGPPHVNFYRETIKLYQLLGRVVTEVYKPWSVKKTVEDDSARDLPAPNDEVKSILYMSEELCKYEEDITPSLHWHRGQNLRDALPEAVRGTVQRQANVLHARYV